MEKAVIYARVSSKEQEETGYSLDSQEKLLRSYSEQHGFKASKLFRISESASGRRQRETFSEMIKFMTKSKINILICEKVDRLTRNFKDAIVIDDWLEENEEREVHLVKDSLKLHKGSRSQEKLNWGIRILFAKNYTDNLSEEVRKGQAAKLEAGHLPTKPPLGYRTVGEQGKKVHVVENTTAPLVRKMFEIYASGNYSVVALTERMNTLGLRNRNGNKMSKTRIHDFLSDPFYYGDLRWKGQVYPGVHEPLISLELYNKVQQQLGRGTSSPYYRTHLLRYKAKVHCSSCDHLISWEQQKGHVYGSCKHCKQPLGAQSKYIKQETLDQSLIQEIVKIAPKNQKILAILEQALKEDAASEIETYEASKKQLEVNLARGNQRIDTAYTDRLDKRISPEKFDSIKHEWDTDRKLIEAELSRINDDKSLYYDTGFSIHTLACKSQDIYQSKKVTDEERRLLLSYAFKKITLGPDKVEITYTPAFEFMQKWVPAVNDGFEPPKQGSNKGQKTPFDVSHPALLRRQDSNLTDSVDLLDRLVRYAPNLTQKLFES